MRASAQLKLFPQIVQLKGLPSLCLGLAADMSSEGVRPAEALFTDSAIIGLVVLVSWLGGGYEF